jgi:hypothetical protein
VNTLTQLTLLTPPAGLVQATVDPFGTKRFDTIKIFVKENTFQVLWHKRQGGNDGVNGDTNWVVTVPRQYQGAFRAAHVGTPSCTGSPFEFYFDELYLTGGLFTTSVTPFGACCGPSGCTDVNSSSQCPVGTFNPWQACSEILCCGTPRADADFDGDVDSDDFGVFQRCYQGPAGGTVPGLCQCFDMVAGGGINDADRDAFAACRSGPEIPFNLGSPPPGCTP